MACGTCDKHGNTNSPQPNPSCRVPYLAGLIHMLVLPSYSRARATDDGSVEQAERTRVQLSFDGAHTSPQTHPQTMAAKPDAKGDCEFAFEAEGSTTRTSRTFGDRASRGPLPGKDYLPHFARALRKGPLASALRAAVLAMHPSYHENLKEDIQIYL